MCTGIEKPEVELYPAVSMVYGKTMCTLSVDHVLPPNATGVLTLSAGLTSATSEPIKQVIKQDSDGKCCSCLASYYFDSLVSSSFCDGTVDGLVPYYNKQ